HPGCTSVHGGARTVRSAVHQVPPPVANMSLTMRCPRLRRAATRLTVLAARSPSGGMAVLARLRGRRRHPAGYVIFRSGRRVLAEAALNSRTATATVIIRGLRRASSVVAVYSGDGYDLPSRARGRNAPVPRHRR
ncbi:MAG: Ig-like domain-containing protein, partial [Solirubrobacteraceae bacterium]